MLSVCIPVYNCNIRELTHDLIQQLNDQEINHEIIVIDDASLKEYKRANAGLKSNSRLIYIELEHNIGRAAIRNLFINYVHFDYLLFLDCDTKLSNKQFVNTYLTLLDGSEKVICGGRVYPERPNGAKYILRWKYGIHRECKLAAERKEKPYHSFMTNNFVIHKNILSYIGFDERLKGYGHEDSLFGYHLLKNNIQIEHIDNQTIHVFNETSSEFLTKTKQGIQNLNFIHTNLLPNGEFCEINKLLKTFIHIKKKRLLYPFALISYLILPPLALLFRLGIVQLWSFDIYKLLYMTRIGFVVFIMLFFKV